MHFSIPDTEEFADDNGSYYMAYNIHVNGMPHCTVRYRQLHSLHEQLRREYGPTAVPGFPPKKFLPLTGIQLEDRRASLEKYIQTVGQDPRLISSEIFTGFLLNAQRETSQEPGQEVALDVFLSNGYRITLKTFSTERSDIVLEKVCREINLPLEYNYYFSLFLIKREEDGDITILRKLQDFESPYITQKAIHGHHRLVIRKSYWDPEYDLELMSNPVALNLLYLQTLVEIEKGWAIASQETRRELASLQARGAKKEYLELARTLKYYGFIQFKKCRCDYPRPGTDVLVSIGNKELNLRIRMDGSHSDEIREGSFKVTRMKCWRITTLHNSIEENNIPTNETNLELSFEYQMAKGKMQWITIASDQAILMSVCLQAMVDELLMKKTGSRKKQPGDRIRNGSWSYMKRDGSSQTIRVNQSSSLDSISRYTNGESRLPPKADSISSMKKLTEKFSSVSLKGKSSSQGTNPFVENDAFEGIGDDDL